jgi:hypothetical protein
MNKLSNITIIFLTAISFSLNPVSGSEICEPKDQLLKAPAGEDLKKCIHSIWFSLGRKKPIDRQFTDSLIKRLLFTTESESKGLDKLKQFDVDYSKIAAIISLMKSEKLIKRYIDFIVFTKNSANELISFGLGDLYTYEAPKFLTILSLYSKEKQDIVIRSLAWGLANNFYPHMTKNNYRRLIAGSYWEVLDESHPNRKLVSRIEKQVFQLL